MIISDDRQENQEAVIEYLKAEIADRDTVINFLLMKVHNSRTAYLRQMRENNQLRRQLGLPAWNSTELTHIKSKQSVAEFERKAKVIQSNLKRCSPEGK